MTQTLRPLGALRAHTIGVHPRTRRVYLPLEDGEGPPVLRVLASAP